MKEIEKIIAAHPQGVSPGELEKQLPDISRATLNRKLRDAVGKGIIVPQGRGAARVYLLADTLSAIRLYIEKPVAERTFARFNEALLDAEPSIDSSSLKSSVARDYPPLDQRELVRFLVDFSCASSVLEGGTYSLLDTQALLEYGEKAPDKPLGDAYLVLNHKNAFEYLYQNLSLDSIFEVHKRLVSSHNIEELKKTPHFLSEQFCGVVREYEEVHITASAYAPPFRPGTRYVGKMLDRILETAAGITDPLKSSFYLLTRLPYLQPFVDGNKRTSRAMCNVPLLKAGLPPLSFMDFGKKDYLVSMLAFYELGDIRLAERCFVDSYKKSCDRLVLGPRIARQP